MQKTAKTKILGRIAFAVFTVLFVCIIAMSFVPRMFGMIPCSVGSDSMEPTVARGSFVLTKPTAFEDIKVSDILLFEAPKTGERFTHRVMDIYTEEKQFVTAGDANDGYDPMTTAYSCVLGKVVYVIPLVGYLSLFVDSLVGKIVIVLFYIVWAAVEIEIYSLKKKGRDSE